MKKLTVKELDRIALNKIQDTGSDYKIGCYNNFINGYREAETKHLATIKKLQRIIKSHRIVIETMYAPKQKK